MSPVDKKYHAVQSYIYSLGAWSAPLQVEPSPFHIGVQAYYNTTTVKFMIQILYMHTVRTYIHM